MENEPKEYPLHNNNSSFNDQDREEEELAVGSTDTDPPLPLTVTSRVLYMLGDITAGPAFRLAQWLELVRKRSGRYRYSGFPHRPYRLDNMPFSAGEPSVDTKSEPPPELGPEVSLWDRLGTADMLDIESSSFSWDLLSSLHHTEHSSSTEHCEDEMNKALEVTVNSGGVVFFALFNQPENGDVIAKEAAAVIKFSSSRMATQSERLGYEFARWLGVCTPQARVVHSCSQEWQQIKEAAEKARATASAEGDEVGEVTCSELLEALELGRCLLLMSYVHGAPLLESSTAFESEAADKTAAAVGRVFLLDLVIRNEDRLPCRQLRWRGNPGNLLLTEKMISPCTNELDDVLDSAIRRYKPRVIRGLQKERRATSVDSRLSSHDMGLASKASDLPDMSDSPKCSEKSFVSQTSEESAVPDLPNFFIVAIDSGVPRRPPAGKRTNDQENYPKLVELLLNSSEYASNLLYDITGGNLGTPTEDSVATMSQQTETFSVRKFRSGFKAALRDLQGFQIFLLTLHQKLDNLLRTFLNITNKITSGDLDRDDMVVPEPISTGTVPCPSTPSKDHHPDFCDSEMQRSTPRASTSGSKEYCDSSSPVSRENWHGRYSRSSGEQLRSLRMTTKLRDIHKYAKVDVESSKELEQWNEMLRNEIIKLCQENNFNTGFFEGSESHCVVDAYELKVTRESIVLCVGECPTSEDASGMGWFIRWKDPPTHYLKIRLEHILDRISLISEAANTEKPSQITRSLFIGGALAAGSVYTLQHLGITHILCLCANEIGQSESQYPDLFEYKNFSICDNEDTNIGALFEEAADFIDHVEPTSGKVLVHCFEGRSRSATVVIAYLMLRKNMTLSQAWTTLRRVHRRAQPNDGFATTLLELDRKLHGKPSMEWQQRRPTMKVCSICGKNAGLSSTSLKFHLQKEHKKLSSGSVDSAMTLEIQKALDALKMTQSGSVTPQPRQSYSDTDD